MSTRNSERVSSSLSNVAAQRSTLKVRNPATGVIYHLVFDGNLKRLTGAQLRRHLEGICLIPAPQQLLLFNGKLIENISTGAEIGLHDKALLELYVQNEGDNTGVREKEEKEKQEEYQTPWRGISYNNKNNNNNRWGNNGIMNVGEKEEGKLYNNNNNNNNNKYNINPINQHLNHSEHSEPRRRFTPPPPPSSSSISTARQLNTTNPQYKQQQQEQNNNNDVIIEEDVLNDINAAMMPLHYPDLADAKLEQKEYIWMMEQMRFETERMHRERELLRQRESLEFEAEILERDCVIVGRRTLQERRKLLELQQWIREEMAMEARLLRMNGESENKEREG